MVRCPTKDGQLQHRWVHYGCQPQAHTFVHEGKEYSCYKTQLPLHIIYNGFVRPTNLVQWPLATDCKNRVWFRPDLYAQYFTVDEMRRAYWAPAVQPVSHRHQKGLGCQ